MSRNLTVAALLASIGFGLVVPAQAQSFHFDGRGLNVELDRNRGDYRRDWDRRRHRDEVSRREAVDIARSYGLVDIDRIVRTEDRWRVVGEDRRGRELRVVIDADNGRIIRILRGV